MEGGEGLEGVGVGDGGVVESGEGFGVDDADHCRGDVGAGVGALVAEFLGTGEGFPEDGCGLALILVQVYVAAADGETVGFADGRDTDDFEVEVEVPGHAPDDDKLLGVLLAEIGAVRLDDVEELGDDGGDTYEVARSRCTFMEVGDGAGVDLGVSVGAVHFLRGGGKDEGYTCTFEHGKVSVKVSGVGGEIFVGAELGRVDEDGSDNCVVLGGGSFDKSHVASVEVAHGGNEAERAVCRGPGGSE